MAVLGVPAEANVQSYGAQAVAVLLDGTLKFAALNGARAVSVDRLEGTL